MERLKETRLNDSWFHWFKKMSKNPWHGSHELLSVCPYSFELAGMSEQHPSSPIVSIRLDPINLRSEGGTNRTNRNQQPSKQSTLTYINIAMAREKQAWTWKKRVRKDI